MIASPRAEAARPLLLLLGLISIVWLGCGPPPAPAPGPPDAGGDAGEEDDASEEDEDPAPTGRDAVWLQQFGTPGADLAGAITEDAAGNVIVAGAYASWPIVTDGSLDERRVFVRKYDASGVELWTHTFPSAVNRERDSGASALTTDADGNVYVGGFEDKGFVRKLSADGELLWSTVLHEEDRNDQVRSLHLAPSGELWVVALLQTSWLGTYQEGGTQLHIARLGVDGTVVVSEEIALGSSEYMLAASINASGQVAVAGARGMNSPVAFVARVDPDGARLWTQDIASDRTSVANAVAIGEDGEVAVTGFFFGSLPDEPPQGGTANAFVRRFDAQGQTHWTRQIVALRTAEGRAVTMDAEDRTFVGGTGLLVEALDAAGASLWSGGLSRQGGGSTYAVAVGPSGRLLVAGSGSFTDQDDHGAVEALVAVFEP